MSGIAASRPMPKRAISIVELDGETVIYDLDSGFLHRLDPLATMIWSCFDGVGTVAEIVTDLADAFDVDRERVEADVVTLLERLAESGLLAEGDGAEPPSPSPAEESSGVGGPYVVSDPPSP